MSAMGTLRLFNATLAAQATPTNDHKALVCIFLFGGNDSNNMLIPYDQANYDAYLGARGEIAVTRETLLPLNGTTPDGREFGHHDHGLGVINGREKRHHLGDQDSVWC